MRKHIKLLSIKGFENKGRMFSSKVEAEMVLHSFCFGIKSSQGKEAVNKKVEEAIAQNYPVPEVDTSNANDSLS